MSWSDRFPDPDNDDEQLEELNVFAMGDKRARNIDAAILAAVFVAAAGLTWWALS